MNGKTVLITGASSGIGKETAKTLIREGYTVYAAARRIEKMADLKALGCIPLKMDITHTDDIADVVAAIIKKCGGVDVLINNAGFGMYGAIEDTPIDEARYQFEVNLFGLAELTRAILPYMRNKGAGKIVNITSVGGKIYTPLGSWYHATKHALEGWSDCLRLEVSPFGIDVIIVEPGAIGTEFGSVLEGQMMKRSGDTVYANVAQSLVTANKRFYEDGAASHPSVIARTISSALSSGKPKTRYVVGKLSKPLLFLRRWLSDRSFDRLIMSMAR
ncbi:MAG: oxidoreductase [Candidatus Thiodiazotropha endolucinida]